VKKVLLIAALMLTALFLTAQTVQSFMPANNASAYTYEGTGQDTGKLKINTYVWGQIQKPGLYLVPDDTDLLTLLSLAGGPTEDAKLSKVRIIRPTAEGEKILWINLKKYLETGDEKMIPIMQPGDTVIIAGTAYYGFARAADFLSKVVITLSLYNIISKL
jgi:polysaccharide export outer membrane protein